MKQIVFYHSLNGAKDVYIFEKCTYTKSGWGMLGFVSLELALELHEDWRWMTNEEFLLKEDERRNRST